MCGIAGILGAPDPSRAPALLEGMLNEIRFRGRDAEGRWTGKGVALAHARLSIIDLETGAQPMEDAEGRLAIVFNGEIYNYLELRAEYEKAGVRFRTASDTEVILAGYRLKGERVCADLNGMFALAIYDRESGSLFLARDRLGKKPLFWCLLEGVFYFASTLDAFRGLPGWRDELDQSALARFCATGFWHRGETVYAQAHSLPAGCWIRALPGCQEISAQTYWRLRFPPAKTRASRSDLEAEYLELLGDALRLRLRSDVPVALTFSGGVDSGTLAALCAKRLGVFPHCYTIDYHTEQDPSEETLVAEEAAKRLGMPWTHIQFDYHKDLLADLDEAYRYYDQPCTQLALVYSQRMYETIKPYATVVLSGNGADELFTGYAGDERFARAEQVLALLRPLRPLLRGLRLPAALQLSVPDAYARSLAARTRAPGHWAAAVSEGALRLAAEAMECGAESALDFKMFLSLGYSGADSNFRLPDVSGLAAQVEVRSPFLDYRMVEYAARLPHCQKVGTPWWRPRVKNLPRRRYAEMVGGDIAWGRKRGMAWNVQFGRSAASDPAYRAAFQAAYDHLDEVGLPSGQFRAAWDAHTVHMRRHGPPSPYGSTTMTGFLLGRWLARKHVKSTPGTS